MTKQLTRATTEVKPEPLQLPASVPLRVKLLTSTILPVPTPGSVKAPVALAVFKVTASRDTMPTNVALEVLSVAVALPTWALSLAVMRVTVSAL